MKEFKVEKLQNAWAVGAPGFPRQIFRDNPLLFFIHFNGRTVSLFKPEGNFTIGDFSGFRLRVHRETSPTLIVDVDSPR